jgi:hypothetical protein
MHRNACCFVWSLGRPLKADHTMFDLIVELEADSSKIQ